MFKYIIPSKVCLTVVLMHIRLSNIKISTIAQYEQCNKWMQIFINSKGIFYIQRIKSVRHTGDILKLNYSIFNYKFQFFFSALYLQLKMLIINMLQT